MHKYAESAINTIKTEIAGLELMLSIFDQKYVELIDLILSCKGKVIIGGIGKSGHIGNKISATLASTGTPSFFIHPTEASHGDLGMISETDIVILLSNSGETKELRDIISYCKRFAVKLIGVVGKEDSELGRASDIAIILPKAQEANNINAPTTSTTMTLALGDAIAMSLVDARGFNSELFKNFHPGGKIGAGFMKVCDIMKKDSDIPLVDENEKMSSAILEITSKKLGCAGVVDKNGDLIGIITDGDLRRHIAGDFLDKTASEVMTKNPLTIDQDSFIARGVNIMNNKSITSLFVTAGSLRNPVGILHLHDCLKIGAV